MKFNLSESALTKAIKYLCKYGDTDVFPHLLELAFFRDECKAIVAELKNLDLNNYDPSGAIEALAPKSRYSFRITHQLGAVDTVLLLAAVVEIGELMEKRRPSSKEINVFSYRFNNTSEESLFEEHHRYKDWLYAQQRYIEGRVDITQIIVTDISDFYGRINFHRLENLLDEVAAGSAAAAYIKKSIKVIRAKQSFGLPVGGAAARLLAELALSDTDKVLIDRGISATRFVDDFRIFLNSEDNAYDVLGILAEHLIVNEGLTLNSSKTKVFSREGFLTKISDLTGDIAQKAEGEALESLMVDIYFDHALKAEHIESLKALNLLEFLHRETNSDDYDVGRIRVIFRALTIIKPYESIKYITDNFINLLVFAKEMTLLMQAIEKDERGCFDILADDVISKILTSRVQLIRTWLLELFVRKVISITTLQLNKMENLSSVLDKRQLHIIRSRVGDQNFFRSNKTKFDQIPKFEQSAFIAGAVCLPKDEYQNLTQTVKKKFSSPTCHLFIKWLLKNRSNVISKLESFKHDVPE